MASIPSCRGYVNVNGRSFADEDGKRHLPLLKSLVMLDVAVQRQ